MLGEQSLRFRFVHERRRDHVGVGLAVGVARRDQQHVQVGRLRPSPVRSNESISSTTCSSAPCRQTSDVAADTVPANRASSVPRSAGDQIVPTAGDFTVGSSRVCGARRRRRRGSRGRTRKTRADRAKADTARSPMAGTTCGRRARSARGRGNARGRARRTARSARGSRRPASFRPRSREGTRRLLSCLTCRAFEAAVAERRILLAHVEDPPRSTTTANADSRAALRRCAFRSGIPDR